MEGKVYDRDICINFADVSDDIQSIAVVISTRTKNLM